VHGLGWWWWRDIERRKREGEGKRESGFSHFKEKQDAGSRRVRILHDAGVMSLSHFFAQAVESGGESTSLRVRSVPEPGSCSVENEGV